MNFSTKVGGLLAVFALSTLNGLAQSEYQFTFHGTASGTNGTGQFITQTVSEKDWIKSYLATHSVTNVNPKFLKVVYHVKGDSHGDTIDLVNSKDGTVLYTIWGLFFSDEFGRLPMVSPDGLQQKRIDYIYGHISDHSIGSSLTSQTILLDRHGRTNRVRFEGQMDYLDLPQGTNKVLRVCSGTFLATKPLKLKK